MLRLVNKIEIRINHIAMTICALCCAKGTLVGMCSTLRYGLWPGPVFRVCESRIAVTCPAPGSIAAHVRPGHRAVAIAVGEISMAVRICACARPCVVGLTRPREFHEVEHQLGPGNTVKMGSVHDSRGNCVAGGTRNSIAETSRRYMSLMYADATRSPGRIAGNVRRRGGVHTGGPMAGRAVFCRAGGIVACETGNSARAAVVSRAMTGDAALQAERLTLDFLPVKIGRRLCQPAGRMNRQCTCRATGQVAL